MQLYFSILHHDLLASLLLHFSKDEIYKLLIEFKAINAFGGLFPNKDCMSSSLRCFWTSFWRKHISSITELLDNPYSVFDKIINDMKEQETYGWVEERYWVIRYLASGGYDILLYPLLQYPSDISNAMKHAATGGHLEIIKELMKKNDPWNYDETVTLAALNRHKNVVEFMLKQRDVFEYYWLLPNAVIGGDIEIIKMILDKNPGEWAIKESMPKAANREINELLCEALNRKILNA